jgi:hypothetical protein
MVNVDVGGETSVMRPACASEPAILRPVLGPDRFYFDEALAAGSGGNDEGSGAEFGSEEMEGGGPMAEGGGTGMLANGGGGGRGSGKVSVPEARC